MWSCTDGVRFEQTRNAKLEAHVDVVAERSRFGKVAEVLDREGEVDILFKSSEAARW